MSAFKKNRSRLEGISDRIWSRDNDRVSSFRLDLPDTRGQRQATGRGKLFHYIAAGGLHQTRAQRREHPELVARAHVIRIFCFLVAFWLFFRFF